MIAIVYPQFYGVGGIARYLDSFLANLPPQETPLILITGDDQRSPRSYHGVELIHVPITSGRFALFTWGLKVRRLLRALHRQGRIKVVNFHWPPLIPGLLLPPEIPVVLTAHTTYLGMSGKFYDTRHYDSQWSAGSLMIKMWMERRTLARVKKVITLTEQGRAEIRAYNFRGPTAVIPNGVDLRMFSPKTDSPDKTIDVLFSGRIERRKGSRSMVQVCRSLLTAQPNIRICIVGYGDDDAWVRSELRQFAPSIEMTGRVSFDEMIQYYERSRIYASTSYYEGLPGTCLEAMGMRLPVVVWDFLFYRGLVVKEQTGMLVAPNAVNEMAATIILLLNQPVAAARFGAAGREKILEDYAWSRLAPQILKELSETD